jgi:hypothetical protein
MKPLLWVLIFVALAGCSDDPATPADNGVAAASTTTPAEPVTCDGGTEVQGFTFDAANAGSSSARGAVEVALSDRGSVSVADFEGPVASGDYEVFNYRSEGKVRVRVTVEDVGGSWRVQHLEGCPPFIDEG